MKSKHRSVTSALKLGFCGALAACVALTSAAGLANAQSSSSDAYQTAAQYVTTFYPLWFTYNQSQGSTANQLIGPRAVTPIYQTVVAVNVDTLYASSFMQLPANDAAILTIPSNITVPSSHQTLPSSGLMYSVLILDPYGNVLQSGVSYPAGTYVFEGPGYTKLLPLPAGAIEVPLTEAHPSIIFRVDKYSSTATSQKEQDDHAEEAEAFRSSLAMQSLSGYNLLDSPSKTNIVSELKYAVPLKAIADAELSLAPNVFLSQLTEAVSSSYALPLNSSEAALSEHFNELYNSGAVAADLAEGAAAAYQQIVQNYLGHRDANGWINFTNIGEWAAGDVIDRASITEFLQFGNNFTAAAYFHVFVDANGQALDGSKSGYEIHFPAGQPPAAQRFWSITAYTPEGIELVPNDLHKYHLASYTSGLTYNKDGSLTIYVGTSKPESVPEANYLPAPSREFNLLLRFYGPEGQVKAKAYVPPRVQPATSPR